MRKVLSVIFLLLFLGTLYAATVFSECNAVAQSDQVKLSWITKSETGIKQFIILRSNNDENYTELKRLNPKGPGNVYEYTDENVVFKDASVLFYKLKAINESGQAVDESSMIVLQSVSGGIKRTWGAIKAMFR